MCLLEISKNSSMSTRLLTSPIIWSVLGFPRNAMHSRKRNADKLPSGLQSLLRVYSHTTLYTGCLLEIAIKGLFLIRKPQNKLLIAHLKSHLIVNIVNPFFPPDLIIQRIIVSFQWNGHFNGIDRLLPSIDRVAY